MQTNKYRLLINSPKTGKYYLEMEGEDIGTAVQKAFITEKFKDKEDKYYIEKVETL